MIKNFSSLFFVWIVLQAFCLQAQQFVSRPKSAREQQKALHFILERAQQNLNQNADSALWYSNAVIYWSGADVNSEELGRALSIKGEIFQKKSDFPASIKHYLNAIQIGEQNNYLQLLGSTYNGIGITFYMMQDYPQAERYIRKALDVKMKQKDYVYYAIIASNLAALLVHQEKNNEALTLLKNAERVVLQEDLQQYLPNIYNSIGAIFYQMQTAQDSALLYYQKSIQFAEKFDIQQNMVTGYHNLGHLLLEKKQYDAALRELKIAEQLAEAMQSAPMILRTVQTLAECYEAAGKIDLALQYRKGEQTLSKEIFDSERQKSIEELQIQYETAEQDRINQEQKGKLLETELKAKKASIQFYVLFFSVLLVAIIAAAIFYFYYQRKLNLAKINQEKIRIFENVVHDIRTPLTLIHGPLQELKSKYSKDQEENTYFGMIERNSEKLIRMVDELLDVSKIDKGKYHVAWSEGNLKEYLEVLLSDFQQEAQEKDIRLSSSLVLPSGNFCFPKDVLEKIVFNLLSNALKYAPPKSEVKMRANIENEHLIIQIEDEGKGIAPKDQAKIFERFYRLQEHQNYPGTGIGLAVVKEFVALVGGGIRVESALGRGSLFEVKLPVQTSQERTVSFEAPEYEKLQLLLCDDDADILTFVRSILAADYDVHAVNNGKEALDFVENNAPDAILSDVMMPELDGIGLLENLKKNPLWESIPVVLFSAKAALESRLVGLEAGADYYIPKPFSPDELKLILRNITSKIETKREAFNQHKTDKKPFDERLKSDNAYVNKATEFVIQNIENSTYSVNDLASDMCISRSQLHRKLTLYTGHSATQFIRMIRLEKAKDLLEMNVGNVEEIAFACGFGSRSYFSSSFAEYFGEAPTDVLRKV